MFALVPEKKDFNKAVDNLVENIAIPPCPDLLASLQKEMSKIECSFTKISSIIEKDPGLTAAVLKTVNSPLYGFSHKIGTVHQAVMVVGSSQITNLVSGILLRKSFSKVTFPLTRFWDTASKRSLFMYHLAKELRSVPVDQAQCFGLFCDIGIPLLIQAKGSEYFDILNKANSEKQLKFTDVEQQYLKTTNHSILGSIMARSWGVSKNICEAIAYHHDFTIFDEIGFNPQVLSLIALNALCDYAIQRHTGLNEQFEWDKFSGPVLRYLKWSDSDVEDTISYLLDILEQDAELS